MTDKPLWLETASLSEVIPYKRKVTLAKRTDIALYGDRVIIRYDGTELVMPFADMSGASVLGKNKINYYYKDKIYQIKGDKHFNALKVVNLYYRAKNIGKEEQNERFLGL